jgi:arylsulfatase
VTPLLAEIAGVFGFPRYSTGQTRFTFHNGTENISSGRIPPIYNRSYSISAELYNPGRSGFLWLRRGVAGVIVAESSFLGGFSLYVQGGRLRHTYSFLGLQLDTLLSRHTLPEGKVVVRYEFTAGKPGELATGGTGRLFINGQLEAEGRMEHTVPFRFSGYAGMDIGTDNGLPVVPTFGYVRLMPKRFRGQLDRVEFELGPAGRAGADPQAAYLERLASALRN